MGTGTGRKGQPNNLNEKKYKNVLYDFQHTFGILGR